MPYWTSIVVAILFWLWAAAQTRMIMVYWGKLDSPVTGFSKGGEPNPVLAATAIRAAITFAALGLAVLFTPWPKVLTYITAIWMIRGCVDVALCSLGIAQFRAIASMWTEKGRRHFILNTCAKAFGNFIWFGVCAYFFGF